VTAADTRERTEITITAQEETRTEGVIEIRGLSKDYGEGRGVFDLDLSVEPGEILGFLGPNGAGKSTTMRMLVGLIQPTGGTARVLGCDIESGSLELRRRTGYLAGDFGLYRQLTARRMLAHLARLHGGVAAGAIVELADRFDAQLDRPIRDLSSGNRQKIGLIQAFMHEPELLILDEPIAGLDPLVQRNFHELLHEVRAEGRAVFLSSHTLSEVDRVADRVAILRRGQLVVVDRLEHLRSLAIRRLDIEFVEPPDPTEFRAIPGVRSAEVSGTLLQVSFEGSADAVVKAAAAHEVVAIRNREDELEDIFLRYYQEDES
jgi:ABC-2 type transport system ATP-binding protein